MNKVIISVIGEDRPGILSAASGSMYSCGCNIENISQTILQSMFGALFIATLPRNLDAKQLQAKLAADLSDLALDVFVKEHQPVNHEASHSEPFVITTFGPDKPGLVSGITRIFANYAINVANLKAVFKGGDDPQDNIMIFEVDVPDDASLPDVRRDLELAARNLGLEINIQHRQIFETMNRI